MGSCLSSQNFNSSLSLPLSSSLMFRKYALWKCWVHTFKILMKMTIAKKVNYSNFDSTSTSPKISSDWSHTKSEKLWTSKREELFTWNSLWMGTTFHVKLSLSLEPESRSPKRFPCVTSPSEEFLRVKFFPFSQKLSSCTFLVDGCSLRLADTNSLSLVKLHPVCTVQKIFERDECWMSKHIEQLTQTSWT